MSRQILRLIEGTSKVVVIVDVLKGSCFERGTQIGIWRSVSSPEATIRLGSDHRNQNRLLLLSRSQLQILGNAPWYYALTSNGNLRTILKFSAREDITSLWQELLRTEILRA